MSRFDDDHDAGPSSDDDLDTGPTTEQRLGLPARDRDYIVPASDGKGNAARLWSRVTPQLARLVAEVLASKKYPFRTPADVVRWCVDFGARRLAVGRGVTGGVLTRVMLMNEALRDEEHQIQFMDYFTTLDRVVQAYKHAGHDGQARRVVAQAMAYVASIADEEDGANYWKDRYRGELTRKYSDLLDAGGRGVAFDGDTTEGTT